MTACEALIQLAELRRRDLAAEVARERLARRTHGVRLTMPTRKATLPNPRATIRAYVGRTLALLCSVSSRAGSNRRALPTPR